ncbi:MAG TPA: hypothetical protein ENJ31_12875, partial [Anaerolineae bacterium]|nr:hypothetical protein [Anaerolineae bacterium]
NVRHGLDRAADHLPRRFTEEALPLFAFERDPVSGRLRRSAEPLTYGRLEDFEAMLDRYYELRGWSPDGVPTAATLRRLGLE